MSHIAVSQLPNARLKGCCWIRRCKSAVLKKHPKMMSGPAGVEQSAALRSLHVAALHASPYALRPLRDPCRIVFVIKELSPERWVNNGGGDFAMQLKAPNFSDVADKALQAEGKYTHWSLFDRFCLANELLDASDSAGMGLCLMFWAPGLTHPHWCQLFHV